MNRSHLTTRGRRSALPVAAWALSAVFAAGSPPARAAAQAGPGRMATAAELRRMSDDGEYRACLRQIGRVLRSGNADNAYDRYDLLLLRGDCLLHLEDPETALASFDAAARSPVPAQAREGRATALLLRRSTGMTYVPRGGAGAGRGLGLGDREGRTRALRALLQDELRTGDADFRRAGTARDLVPIRDVLVRLGDLYAVERTATGGDAQMRPILEGIGQRARTLIEQELGLREQQITAIEAGANRRDDVVVGGLWWGRSARRGLRTSDRRELRDLIDYLRRVEETTGLGQQLAASFDADAGLWEPLTYRASMAIRRAQDVLEAE